MPAGMRRKSREAALHLLYSLDMNPLPLQDAIELYRSHFAQQPEVWAYAAELVKGVHEHLDEIDQMVSEASKNWKVERMARVDRNILRLATCELKYRQDIPVRVCINEALEIARRFSTEEARAFINGILDKIASKERPGNITKNSNTDSKPKLGNDLNKAGLAEE